MKTEIRNARQRELKEGKRVLFPIRLVPFETIHDWKAFDADTGKDMAVEIREYFIHDEISHYAKSCRRRYEAIQREPNEARKRELSEQLEAHKNDVSPLLFGIRRAVDRMRVKYLRASYSLSNTAL